MLGEALRVADDPAGGAEARAWSNLGNAYQDLLRLDDAQAAHDRAVSLASNDSNLHWNRAINLLLSGDLETGFAAYESRAETRDHAPPAHNSPRWDGSDPAGKRLLLLTKQGFGDAIQNRRSCSRPWRIHRRFCPPVTRRRKSMPMRR